MLVNCVAYQSGTKLADVPVGEIRAYISRPDCFVWVAIKDPQPGDDGCSWPAMGGEPTALPRCKEAPMRVMTLIVGLVVVAACRGGGGAGSGQRADTLTRRQRDSAIGASNIPGARGVRGALEASDSAAARRARLDSLSRP